MPSAKKTSKPARSTPVSSVRHHATRTNIPTEELRDFVADDEKTPKTILYPRDSSLDPQLVWKGKDEQDQQDLAVPAVPIYIQEKIQPQAIIENIRANSSKAQPEPQMALFSDFNGLPFEDLIDFYHHDQHWSNRMILGDSLMAMTSLAEKEGLKGKVQMIYMDPPYGIKFGSNWQVSTRKRDVKDGKAEDTTRQPEQIKAFRDTWQLGIHSYLSYLRDRLYVARELLTESGSVFVQIGDENVHLVRSILDEVFGSENFCAGIIVRKTTGAGSPSGGTDVIAGVVDHVLWYARDKTLVKYRQLYQSREGEGWVNYNFLREATGLHRTMSKAEREDWSFVAQDAFVYRRDNLTSTSSAGVAAEPYFFDGKSYSPYPGGWKTSKLGMVHLQLSERLEAYGNTLSYRRFAADFPWFRIANLWEDTATGGYAEQKTYVVQTNSKIVERCLVMSTDPGDLVLDPTCGSGTTAYVAEQRGRRWITVDTSRVAIALARTRLMAGRYPYYLLADSPAGAKKERELAGTMGAGEMGSDGAGEKTSGPDIRRGFVYKRVPHVTLKSIANNDEIDAIHAEWQTQLEPVRAELNKLLKQSWEEWQVPREAGEKWPEKARELNAEWWRLRQGRQAAIDASIARHADTELLYDQPYEDNKRVRVSGPFTVESLSPHRVLTTEDEGPKTEIEGRKQSGPGQFESMILENLKAAGVQNTVKKERLKFDRLESYAGAWLQAAGEYSESGKSKRVAVCIGPEHGTVGPELVKDAAKEAVQGVGFDLLVVCGFAFDPHVSEEVKRYGKLTVLPARMNPDLAMGDALLKTTGAGNLFMVFGEPDLDIKTQKDGKLVVEIKGVDVYDPTTGEIRSNKTDDIACWFIDTDYNEESFFVRHAYFTGADEPYEKLKRALRAEVDEGAWSALYSTKSYPFDKPASGKIAVKVINHYGDEVLKVYAV